MPEFFRTIAAVKRSAQCFPILQIVIGTKALLSHVVTSINEQIEGGVKSPIVSRGLGFRGILRAHSFTHEAWHSRGLDSVPGVLPEVLGEPQGSLSRVDS